jgi:hypothetical protein
LQTRELAEADDGMRQAWEIPKSPDRCELFDRLPVCFVDAFNLGKEIIEPPIKKQEVAGIIHKERDCPRFTAWKRGHSPREHLEMIESIEVARLHNEQREKERTWQEEQRKRDEEREERLKASERAWQEEQRRRDQEHQERLERERDRRQAEQNRLNRLVQIAVALIGLVGIIVVAFLANYLKAPDPARQSEPPAQKAPATNP